MYGTYIKIDLFNTNADIIYRNKLVLYNIKRAQTQASIFRLFSYITLAILCCLLRSQKTLVDPVKY